MKNNKEKITESSRSEQRAKRRKTNIILNSLIMIVVVLIVIVSVNIFGEDDRTEAEKNTEQTVANVVNEDSDSDDQQSKTSEKDDGQSSDEEELDVEEQDLNEEDDIDEETEITDEHVVIEGGRNPEWEPVGTTQIEPAQDYDRNGVDWREQVRAVSYATGFDRSKGDSLLRLENNGPKKSAATVLIKDTNKKYRVYLEWIDGGGWKPALVEEMAN